jgi:hypothetical protein
LIGVVLLKSLDFNILLCGILLFGVLEFPLHIVVGPRHQVLELILLFFKFDFADLFLVDKFVALHTQQIEFFYLVLKHELQLLYVRLIEFVALEPFLLEQLHLQL